MERERKRDRERDRERDRTGERERESETERERERVRQRECKKERARERGEHPKSTRVVHSRDENTERLSAKTFFRVPFRFVLDVVGRLLLTSLCGNSDVRH